MTKNNVKKTLNEMKELTGYMKKLNEDYFMDDEPQAMPQENPEMHQPEAPEQSEEQEKAQYANEVIQQEPIIAKIRETAIDGLKKYADQPTSKNYNFFKKVFLETDKVLTDAGKD